MKRSRLILIILSLLILCGCIGMTAYLLFSNYRNVRLFKQAQSNFLQGDEASLDLAESQLQQVIRLDSDNEAAFIMLGEIARKKKVYPEQVYYCHMAYRLNPLSQENREKYIDSLCMARYFVRLEMILAQESSLSDRHSQLLLYAAGRNGNINKYKAQLSRRSKNNGIGELALLLFHYNKLSDAKKLAALERIKSDKDLFLKQELLVARTDLSINCGKISQAEESLRQACELNQYAFAPALGRFYAEYRNFQKALDIFEKHLSVYHDQSVAMQIAEIYCLLKKTDEIEKLRTLYQSDSGSRAMLCNYYFDALIALAKDDMASLKELVAPLRNNINTPLAAFMFFCADIQSNDLAAIQASYMALLGQRNYLNLQKQADNILAAYLRNSFKRSDHAALLGLAQALYTRQPDVFKAKFILLAQRRSNSVNVVLLKDALKRFGNDQGIVKIAIEYYLRDDLAEAESLIASYKQKFSEKSGDMLRYEIILNMRKKDHEKVSELFRRNLKGEILFEYWNFASSLMREKDLLFLSNDRLYGPFSKALLLIKQGKKQQACDILVRADDKGNQTLLFFAAKTLAENGRSKDALKKYEKFPQKSSFRIPVLLNMSELYAETGDLDQALLLANRAYDLAPQMAETQLCYADKLHKKGNLIRIPDIVKISSVNPYRRKMEHLWVAGMQQRIKDCDINTQKEKLRELCRQLLVISPRNAVALEFLKKIRRMQ